MGTTSAYFTTPGTYSYQLPWGSTFKAIRCWGAGGYGGNVSTSAAYVAGGGGGGGFCQANSAGLAKFDNGYGFYYIDITVGAGQSNSGTSESPATSSVYIRASDEVFGEGTLVALANGGGNVTANSTAGASGGGYYNTALTEGYNGGNGANGSTASQYSGGGGGGAGINASGGNASTYIGGTGSGTYGGNGGNGLNRAAGNGTNGTASGGGGGGAAKGAGLGTNTGGAGADGRVYIDISWPDNVNMFVNQSIV